MTGAAHTESVKFVYSLRKWTGDTDAAFEWFSELPLPSFGGRTAADLVREGRVDAVKGYIERVATGGFA
ncbi:antitoxin Xre/MbcA/ParS toxin-binding domain-containing protein [Primorskyibacter flagellatus]